MKMRAPDHQGMKVYYRGLLVQACDVLSGASHGLVHAEMLRQLQEHLREMGERFYAGDVAAVDEFLQLYCIASDRRDTPVPVDTEAAIQKLASELPEGYEVNLCIERGAGWVTWYDQNNMDHAIQKDEATMGELLLEALRVTKEEAA